MKKGRRRWRTWQRSTTLIRFRLRGRDVSTLITHHYGRCVRRLRLRPYVSKLWDKWNRRSRTLAVVHVDGRWWSVSTSKDMRARESFLQSRDWVVLPFNLSCLCTVSMPTAGQSFSAGSTPTWVCVCVCGLEMCVTCCWGVNVFTLPCYKDFAFRDKSPLK